tara:strand:- start:244 stop:1353 length:1110 start_codon:yes stop_codon:yes gene_type:complete
MTKFNFEVQKVDGYARKGLIKTKRGDIDTPAFMPIATQGAIKFTPIEFIEQIGFDLILSNTYHLLLKPGLDRLKRADGISDYMCWKKPLLTDSGGFQVMSLSKLRKISEEGVKFQSHIDGTSYFLTPENVIDYQNIIKSDMQMVLDECIKYPENYTNVKKAMELSLRWAERSRNYYLKKKNEIYGAQFGIIHGGVHEDLREVSINETTQFDFEGYALGGLAVGEGHMKMIEVVNYTAPQLPENKIRYLMGVGRPIDIVEAVYRGVDIFDCVIPTREGRHGLAYIGNKSINLRNSKFEDDYSPLDEKSEYFVSSKYSKSYLNHLLKIKDPLGSMLISLHNLNFYYNLMQNMRKAIDRGIFEDFRAEFLRN